jgi:lauroyl/myristoyl acyltransferase
MTIGTNDIILFALHALKRFQPNRKIVIYGEDMEVYCAAHPEYQELFAQNTIHGMKKILSILDEGGIFITYPDFTYKQHLTVAGTLFGIERAFSSSFLKILLKSKAVLLPMTATRLKSALQMHFYAPILYNTNEEYENLPTEIKIKILCTLISKIIEGLILKVPNQWRLLPTLSHESQDMA